MRAKNRQFIFMLLFALIPFISVVLYAAFQGMTILQINPFYSLWNDEVFYYKQIEGIVSYGMPQGYFGYNESIAQIGTLGAWSPFLLYPYAILGKLFGISPYHILWFNLLILCISFLIFYVLTKPSLTQSLLIFLMFLAVPSYMRYSSAYMVEALIFGAVIVLAGLLVRFARKDYGSKSLLLCYLLVVYLSLCRPYFLIYLIIPVYYHYKLNRRYAVLGGVFSVAVFLGLYLFFVLPHAAAYFFPLIDTEMFSVLKEEGFFSFIRFLFLKLFAGLKSIAKLILGGIGTPNASASIYCLFLFLGGIYLIILCVELRKQRKKLPSICAPELMALIICAAIMLAIIFFYSIEIGARHLMMLCLFLQLILVSLFTLPVKTFSAIILAIGLLSWSAIGDKYSFSLPRAGDDTAIVLEDAELLSDAFSVEGSDKRWDNTVAYCYSGLNWNYCYFLPKGVGVEFVLSRYEVENCSEIKSGYALTARSSASDELYTDAGWEPLVTGRDFVLYKRQ